MDSSLGNVLRLGIHGERVYFDKGASLYSGIAFNATIIACDVGEIGNNEGTIGPNCYVIEGTEC